MHQRGYINDVLSRFGMSDCKPVATPNDPGMKLEKKIDQTQENFALLYRELMKALIYLSSTTRPDIAFAVCHLGQFSNCYGAEHWKAAKRVLQYLKETMDVGLTFADQGVRGRRLEGQRGRSTIVHRLYISFEWRSLVGGRKVTTNGGVIYTRGGVQCAANA